VREFIILGSPIVKQKAAVDTAAGAGFPCREQKTTGNEYTVAGFRSTGNRKEKAVYRCTHRTDMLLLKRAVM
jgi:hypothetical protein